MTLHILIDDKRDLNGMDIILRTPEGAIDTLNTLNTTGHFLYMDNDLAKDSIEGHQILKRVLELGERPKKVILVTSNPVAAEHMREMLLDVGYQEASNRLEYNWK